MLEEEGDRVHRDREKHYKIDPTLGPDDNWQVEYVSPKEIEAKKLLMRILIACNSTDAVIHGVMYLGEPTFLEVMNLVEQGFSAQEIEEICL